MSEEQEPFDPVARANFGEGARRTVTKAFDAPSAIPSPLEAIESARKEARAELRDEFAKAALIGIYANPGTNPKAYFSDDCAQEIWAVAEKMMKARGDD